MPAPLPLPRRLRNALRLLALALALALTAAACPAHARDCALTASELRSLVKDAAFSLRWREVGMADGKPLLVTLAERQGELFLHFWKSQEGLWAEGPASICEVQGSLRAHLSQQRIQPGPAAPWLLRQSLAHGATFALTPQPGGRLHISTPGWSGAFVPASD